MQTDDATTTLIKHIVLPMPKANAPKPLTLLKDKEKEKKRKKMSMTEEWNTSQLSTLSHDKQLFLLEEMIRNKDTEPTTVGAAIRLGHQHVQTKLAGYKHQDTRKQLLNLDAFVTLSFTLSALKESHLQCFYCREPVLLFYEFCNDPKQWTLERIDNDYGHNQDNVQIACLQCNVRRRTMYHERYVMTKQCHINKVV